LASGRNYFSVLNNSSQFDTELKRGLANADSSQGFEALRQLKKITPALLRPADYGGHYTLFCGCNVKCILASPTARDAQFRVIHFHLLLQGSHETNEDHEGQRHLAEIV